VDDLLKRAWVDYAARSKKLLLEPTFGSRMTVRLACFTIAFFDALLAVGTERDYAINLTRIPRGEFIACGRWPPWVSLA
jgi:hypothetical protein